MAEILFALIGSISAVVLMKLFRKEIQEGTWGFMFGLLWLG